MENILNYAIQINVLLSVVYLGYVLLLKNLTFYLLNRMYFITGILFSFTYPFLDIQSWFRKPIPSVGEIAMDWSMDLGQEVDKSVFTLNNVLILLLFIGVTILSIRFLIQMISLLRIHIYSQPAQWQSYLFRNVFIPIVPFSFLNKIYVNKDHHPEPELMDIFKHEDIHVKGLHSIDILISEFTLISSWFNPFVWLMRKAIRENLEFLTDQQVLNNGVDRQTYQYSLLRVNTGGGSATLGNQFSFKTLKRRIMMMNKKRSAKIQLGKYAFMLPIFVLTAGAFTLNKAEAKITAAVDAAKEMNLEIQLPNEKELKGLIDNSIKIDSLAIGEISLKDIDFKKNYLFKIDARTVPAKEVKALKQDEIVSVKYYKQGDFSVSHVDDLDKDGLIIVYTKKALAEKERLKEEARKRAKLFLLDGKEITLDELKKIDTKTIASFMILKKEDGFAKYGEKGKNGVLEMSTNSNDLSETKNIDLTDASNKRTMSLRGEVIGLNVNDNSLSITGVPSGSSFKTSDGIVTKSVVRIGNPIAGKEVILILDGKEIDNDDLNKVNPDDIKEIQVLKDNAAIVKYGEKAKNGVVLITTKSKGGEPSETIIPESRIKDNSNKIESTYTPLLTNVVTGKRDPLQSQPLYVLDGKIYEGNINKINQSMIASIEVLKGPSAHALYGSKGENGVMIVTTKTSAEKNPDTLKTDIKKIINREISKERIRQDSVKTLKGGQVNQIKVTGYKKSADDFYATTLQQEKLKKFLNDNKGNINPKDGYVLVINGKVARESDLKAVDAKTVTKVMATDLTTKNSPLSKNIIGLLALESSANKKAVRGASASVVKNGKEIKLLVSEVDQNPRIMIK